MKFTSTGVTRSRVFLTMDSFMSVSRVKSFPSDPVTVNLIPFSKGVGGTTIQNSVASSLFDPNVTGSGQVSVIEVPAFESKVKTGVVPILTFQFASPDNNSPFRPSSVMDEMETSLP